MIYPESETLPFHMNADGRIHIGEASSSVTLDMVLQCYGYDMTIPAIAKTLSISKADVCASILFYERHRHEVSRYLRGELAIPASNQESPQNKEGWGQLIYIPDGGPVQESDTNTGEKPLILLV